MANFILKILSGIIESFGLMVQAKVSNFMEDGSRHAGTLHTRL